MYKFFKCKKIEGEKNSSNKYNDKNSPNQPFTKNRRPRTNTPLISNMNLTPKKVTRESNYGALSLDYWHYGSMRKMSLARVRKTLKQSDFQK